MLNTGGSRGGTPDVPPPLAGVSHLNLFKRSKKDLLAVDEYVEGKLPSEFQITLKLCNNPASIYE